MATLRAKKAALKSSAAKAPSNHSELFDIMFGFGETYGQGTQAKLKAALKFQDMVAKELIDVSTDELRKAAIADAANGYDAGQAHVTGSAMLSTTLEGLRTEFGSFIRDEVISKAADGYKLIADIVKGKDSTQAKLDQYQQRLEVNRSLTKKEGVIDKADITERLLKVKKVKSAADEIAAILKDAQRLIKAKLKFSPKQKKALVALIADLS
jgi:hypothetical protein